ncbi:MAG: nucleoside 2-deoxyribosyltransferase [Gluconacetobacter diazotrophicus]|nr:nucleoside 2-deoxyribosyltransferase [Gluconacetobacter diazotrophicus]
MRAPRIYLAGPDVFLPHAAEHGNRLKALCRRHGAIGLFPIDNEIDATKEGRDTVPERIRSANLRMIRGCDAVVANMMPFRGPAMDGGTAYEMGFAAALERIVVGYQSREVPPFHARVAARGVSVGGGADPGGLRDGEGFLIEAFRDRDGLPLSLPDNLMMGCGLDGLAADAEGAIVAAATLWRQRQQHFF